jgi:hypothetical protein
MSKKSQFGRDDTAELSRVSGGEVQTVVDPATISALVSAGALVLDFIGHLVGGKTGAALSGLSAQINGLSTQLMSIAAKAQEIIMKVEETITAVDTQSLAMASPVHDQVLAYGSAFPQGVPATADTKNPSYVFADNNSKTAITYFQDIGPARGPIALCRVSVTSPTRGWRWPSVAGSAGGFPIQRTPITLLKSMCRPGISIRRFRWRRRGAAPKSW